MEQPLHDFRPFQATDTTPRRFVGITIVGILHIIVIYALATGLAQNLVAKLPQEFKAEVIPPKQEQVKPPPPPPPELQKPPPPFVPPPEINIQTEAPSTNTITVQSKVAAPVTPAPPAPPKPAGITAPASIGAPHNCPQARWYPPIALRLNQEGTTTLAFTITTDGSITDVSVAESSGFSSLDDAAVRCAQASWHYKPALQNGQPVQVPWKAKVLWKLSG
jgi:protein TonB